MKNQFLLAKLAEADDLVQEMSKLIDVARNKHLQKKLLKYHDGSQ